MQVIPDPPKEEWEPTKLTFRIRTGDDLWRVFHKSKWGRLTVPSIEFEIQADGQRHIDTLYNHIGNAVTNLAAHASSLPQGEFSLCLYVLYKNPLSGSRCMVSVMATPSQCDVENLILQNIKTVWTMYVTQSCSLRVFRSSR